MSSPLPDDAIADIRALLCKPSDFSIGCAGELGDRNEKGKLSLSLSAYLSGILIAVVFDFHLGFRPGLLPSPLSIEPVRNACLVNRALFEPESD